MTHANVTIEPLPSTEASNLTKPESVFAAIELSAKEALEPSSTTHGRSISNGIAAVFIEHGRLTPPPPHHYRNGSSSSSHDSDDSSVPSLRVRKRDKILKAIRYITPRSHPRAPSNESKKHHRHFRFHSNNSDGSSRSRSRELMVARQDIFPENVNAPVVEVVVPKPGSRIDTTPQLALCSILLTKHLSMVSGCEESEKAADVAEEPPQDLSTITNEEPPTNNAEGSSTDNTQDAPIDSAALEWLKAQDHIEQGRINWLTSKMVEGFIEDSVKDSTAVAEVVLLGPVLDREYYRKLLSCFISEFDQAAMIDVDLLQGLVQLVQSASPGFLVADDLVKILRILRIRLEGIHQQAAEHPYHLTLAISRILDVMADHGVEELDRVLEHEPLSKILASLKGSSDPYLMYQASHAFQALQYVPNDESPLQALLRYSLEVADGLSKVSAIKGFNLPTVLEGLEKLKDTATESYEVAVSVYEGVSALLESGQSVLEIFCGGTGYGHKRRWYSALCAARVFVEEGRLAELNQLICQAPCRRDSLFQWGICQLLGEIATDMIWTTTARQQSVDLLEELYKSDTDWGRDECVKSWMVSILRQLSDSSDQAVQARALTLLQDLNLDQSTVIQHPYPLRNRLPMPTSSTILAKVQDIPYVEYELHQVQKQRLEEGRQTVYIPPQAKASLQARDEDLFPLMEKVQDFLASERQVMLILGDSGSGKSVFNRHLEYDLWTDYKMGGTIPLLINLPAIDRPEENMIGKHLRMINFSEVQVQEMKQHRQFILICDGYDESLQTVNLHKTNLLNQTGQWTAKMVICCRSQYLGLSYHNRFKPQPVDRYNSNSVELFQEATIAPFSKDQVKGYIEQFSQNPKTKLLFGDRPVWSSEQYLEKLVEIPNLMDLVKNPFLLALTLKALPGLADSNNDLSSVKVTRVGLYDKFAEQWLEINMQRLLESKLSSEERAKLDLLVDDGFVPRGLIFLERLAACIFKEQDGNPIVQYSRLREADTWKEDFFSQDPMVKLLRDASPLNRTGNQYRFIHRTVLEYFYSRAIYSPAKKNADTAPQDLANTSITPSLLPVFDNDCPLFKKSLRKEPSVIQFLCDRVQQNTDFKQQLLAVLELSKTDPTASQAAANAITILIKSGVLFNSADLRGVRIPEADLSDGQFDYAQFQGADLKGANFTRSWLRCADFSKARLDDVRFGELPYLSHAYSCAFSSDGSLLAVGLFNDGIAIYDVKTWTKLHSLKGQEQFVLGLSYSPSNSPQVVSGGSDCIVRLWDSVKNELLFEMDGHTGYVAAVAFSPNGENIASASDDKTIRVWSSLNGQLIFILEGHTATVTGLAYSPTGQYIVSGCKEGTTRLWNAKTGAAGAIWCSNPASPILCIAHSSDGQWVASGHKDGAILLRNSRTGEIGATLLGHSSRVRGIAFSPSSQWIVSASRDHTVRLWDVVAGTVVSVLNGHTSDVTALTFSPDGLQVASASEDNTVLWDVSSSGNSSDMQRHGHTGYITGVAYSPDGLSIVSSSDDRTVRTWDASTGAAGSFFLRLSSPTQVVAYSPTGEHIVTSGNDDNNNIALWNSQTGVATGDIFSGHAEPVRSLAFSSCGRWIVTASSDKTLRLWDISPGSIQPGCILASNQAEVRAVTFSPSGAQFVTAGTDDKVQLWDVQTRQVVATLQGRWGGNAAVAFSPNGEQIAIGGATETLYLWDGKSTQPEAELRGHTDSILCIAYSPISSSGEQWIASGSSDRIVRLWRRKASDEPTKWTCVAVVKGFSVSFRHIAWSPTSAGAGAPLEFVTGYQDHSVRVWRVVEEVRGSFRVCLVWSSGVIRLVAVDLTTKGATGLSNMNRHLLVQRGAIDNI